LTGTADLLIRMSTGGCLNAHQKLSAITGTLSAMRRNDCPRWTGICTTGWQQHSVRGFLAGVVRKRLKLKLESKKVDGNRVYQIAKSTGRKSKPQPSKRQSS
jgi:hypothetical protein